MRRHFDKVVHVCWEGRTPTTLKQRHINVDATSRRCIDVDTTLFGDICLLLFYLIFNVPVSIFSVMSVRVFLCWSCSRTQHSDVSEARFRGRHVLVEEVLSRGSSQLGAWENRRKWHLIIGTSRLKNILTPLEPLVIKAHIDLRHVHILAFLFW